MDATRLAEIQQALREQQMDGWLFYDFRRNNPIAYRVLDLVADGPFTGRWYYWIPAQGEPQRIVSAIEAANLDSLPGTSIVYRDRHELAAALAHVLEGHTRIAMEYSPLGELPVVSRVDAGTVESLRALGKTVLSSADLVQQFDAVWSPAALDTHLEAERRLADILQATLAFIREQMRQGRPLTEYDVQQAMLALYKEHDLFL